MKIFKHRYDGYFVEAVKWPGPTSNSASMGEHLDRWLEFEDWVENNRNEHQLLKYYGRLFVIFDYDDKRLAAEPGDWIVKHHSGIYPVPATAFDKMYKEVEHAQAG